MNSNMTWKQLMFISHKYNRLIHGLVTGNPLNRHNATSKIQHRFRQWRYKIELEASTHVLPPILCRDDNLPILPIELIHHISMLKMT
jgi:hypothetical protein